MTIIEDYRPANSVHGIWRTDTYDLSKGADIARYIARKRYAWPGHYELFAITDDCGVLCHDCCKSEYYQIRTAYAGDGWNVEGYSTADWLDGEETHCDHCNKAIG